MAAPGESTGDDETDDRPDDDRGNGASTGPLARIKNALREAVGVVADAVIDAL